MPRAYMVIYKLHAIGRDYSPFFNALKQVGEGPGYGFESVWVFQSDDLGDHPKPASRDHLKTGH